MRTGYLLGLVVVGGIWGSGGELIRRDLTKATTEQVEIKISMVRSPAEGVGGDPKTIKIKWNAAYSIGVAGADGKSPVDVAITEYDVSGDIRYQPGKEPTKERAVKCVLDSRNQIGAAENEKIGSLNQGWLLADRIQFPEKEVAVGDSWAFTPPSSNILGEDKVTLNAKLTGEEEFRGKKVWVMTVSEKRVATHSKVQLQMQNEATTKSADLKGSADVTMKALIEKGTGKLLSLTVKVHKEERLEMPGMGDQPPSSVDYTATVMSKAEAK